MHFRASSFMFIHVHALSPLKLSILALNIGARKHRYFAGSPGSNFKSPPRPSPSPRCCRTQVAACAVDVYMEVSINGVPPNGWFISWKITLKWMIWGYLYFRKKPYLRTAPIVTVLGGFDSSLYFIFAPGELLWLLWKNGGFT